MPIAIRTSLPMKADGVKFAIVRAGFSETEDKLLKTHIDGLQKVGIPFGLYCGRDIQQNRQNRHRNA